MKKIHGNPALAFAILIGLILLFLSAAVPILSIPQERYYKWEISGTAEELSVSEDRAREILQDLYGDSSNEIPITFGYFALLGNLPTRLIYWPLLAFGAGVLINKLGILRQLRILFKFGFLACTSIISAYILTEVILGSHLRLGAGLLLGGAILILLELFPRSRKRQVAPETAGTATRDEQSIEQAASPTIFSKPPFGLRVGKQHD